MTNCPKCGAEPIVPTHPAQRCIWWTCNSYQFLDGLQEIVESVECLRRQLAAKHTLLVKSEHDFLESQEANSILTAQRDRAVAACRELVATTQRAVVNNVFGVTYEVLPKAYGMCKAVVTEADADKEK